MWWIYEERERGSELSCGGTTMNLNATGLWPFHRPPQPAQGAEYITCISRGVFRGGRAGACYWNCHDKCGYWITPLRLPVTEVRLFRGAYCGQVLPPEIIMSPWKEGFLRNDSGLAEMTRIYYPPIGVLTSLPTSKQ